MSAAEEADESERVHAPAEKSNAAPWEAGGVGRRAGKPVGDGRLGRTPHGVLSGGEPADEAKGCISIL